ncbi:DNA/RNA-binding domain E.t1.c1-type [Penicillium taxi]|uniref:DNA/RNA-binding domain E.t1.c1-type n=1 Tax=Penicillium taxi TaxID=168475 RepID=UPI002545B077|nr:DNA/RNA-binding domain E.t1.c1-type [Penicillium taxi]KAJ5908104.1 DNA/RNA-binding domain E.t1.c1-type [Penicillium taxi]
MLLEAPTNRVTEENLIDSVRATYATLVMLERQCIDTDKIMSEGTQKITSEEWECALNMHQSLLAEFHDFFIVTQHECASKVVRCLPNTYAMPARLWRYSIHTFLELLRQNLPGSFDFMLEFVYIAYRGIALLLDQLSAFKEVWIECLGDLARYRMAIEDQDMGDRKVWAQVSRRWYNEDANLRPGVGRIQHHLAVLSRPDYLQQLFYYTKALVSPQRFDNAQEGVNIVFSLHEKYSFNQHTLVTAFITTHRILFKEDLNEKGHMEHFIAMANHFLSLLRDGFCQLEQRRQYGVYIMSSNFASMLEYGKPESIIASKIAEITHASTDEAYTHALTCSYNDPVQIPPVPTAFHGSCLSFHTLSVLLDRPGDPDIYPGFHTSLAMIWCLSLQPPLMQHLQHMIPWLAIVRCLNTIFSNCSDTLPPIIEDRAFPTFSYGTLREDFLIRAQTWSRLYYPKKFFENAISEDDRPFTEEAEATDVRQYRCLWLGIRIASALDAHSGLL